MSINSIDDEINFEIFPNPTTNELTVSILLQKNAKVEIEVFNAIGQLQSNQTAKFSTGKNEFNIKTVNFPKGVYYVKVSVNGNVAVRKMLKM